ncbi:MAG TPA: MMPL family transporter [Steroidobacteraceae bacterium]|nr:MMPL family transporter [Steroidobacteraceae bacterium]
MTRAGRIASGAFLALAACATAIVVRAHYTADLSAFLPRAPSARERLLVEQLRTGLAARLIMVAVTGGEAHARAQLTAALAGRLRADPQFLAVNDGDASGEAALVAFAAAHRYLLSDAVTAQRFTASGLHEAIGATLALLASPEGLLVKPLFTRDPTGETLNVLDALASERLPTREGVWSSRDGRRALLIAETRAAGSDTDAQQRAADAIRRAFAELAAARPAPSGTLTLALSGPGVFAVSARALIRDSVMRLSVLGALAIGALLLFAYRSVAALLLTFVPVASGALAGVAAVALAFGTVHGITLGFGITLIGEAVDYSIYLFIQSPAGSPAGDWRHSVWPTIRLGMLTSVCGFAALVPSGFQGLAQLGVFSIAGLIAAALVTRFVLPEWRPPALALRDLSSLGHTVRALLVRLTGARLALALIALGAALVLFLDRHTLLSRELADLSPIPAAAQALDARLRADLGAPDARYLVIVPGPDAGAALDAAQAVARALTRLTAAGVIGGFESPTRYLPGPAVQRARQASLPAPDALAARLPQALEGFPVTAARLGPFLADVAAARSAPPVTAADLAGTPLAAATDALLAGGGATTSAFLPITPPGEGELPAAALEALRTAVAAACPAAHLLDLKAEADALYAHYLAQAVRLSLAGLAALVLLLALACSPARALRMVAPLALAVLTVAAGLALAGERLGILHVVGMLLIVAVGSNYALFFDRLGARAAAVPRTLASLLIANLATVMGFGVLAFSAVPVLAALGRTVAPGALLALLYAALLAPLPPPPPATPAAAAA